MPRILIVFFFIAFTTVIGCNLTQFSTTNEDPFTAPEALDPIDVQEPDKDVEEEQVVEPNEPSDVSQEVEEVYYDEPVNSCHKCTGPWITDSQTGSGSKVSMTTDGNRSPKPTDNPPAPFPWPIPENTPTTWHYVSCLPPAPKHIPPYNPVPLPLYPSFKVDPVPEPKISRPYPPGCDDMDATDFQPTSYGCNCFDPNRTPECPEHDVPEIEPYCWSLDENTEKVVNKPCEVHPYGHPCTNYHNVSWSKNDVWSDESKIYPRANGMWFDAFYATGPFLCPAEPGKCDECHWPPCKPANMDNDDIDWGKPIGRCFRCHPKEDASWGESGSSAELSGCTACHEEKGIQDGFVLVKKPTTGPQWPPCGGGLDCILCHEGYLGFVKKMTYSDNEMDVLRHFWTVFNPYNPFNIGLSEDPHKCPRTFKCIDCHEEPSYVSFGPTVDSDEDCYHCHQDAVKTIKHHYPQYKDRRTCIMCHGSRKHSEPFKDLSELDMEIKRVSEEEPAVENKDRKEQFKNKAKKVSLACC